MKRRPPKSPLFPYPTLFRSPPTQQQGFYHDDPTHAQGRPPSAPVNRPPAAAGSAEQYSRPPPQPPSQERSEEHTSELQSRLHIVCRLLLEKKHYNRRTCTSV